MKNPVEFREWFKTLFREWRPHLSANQFQVVQFIFDRTAGWGKEWEIITNRQFLTGVVGRDGKQYASGLGLTEPTLIANRRALIACGAIRKREAKPSHQYALNYEWKPDAADPQPNKAKPLSIPNSRLNLQSQSTPGKATEDLNGLRHDTKATLVSDTKATLAKEEKREMLRKRKGFPSESRAAPGAGRECPKEEERTIPVENNPSEAMASFEGHLAGVVAFPRSCRQAKVAAWTPASAAPTWQDLCRASHPTAIHVAITKTDGNILHRYGKRWMAASGPRAARSPVAWLEYLQWVVARWLVIREAHFAWMKQASPGVPSVRFLVKFSDRYEAAWEDRATMNKMAAMPTRECEIEKRVRRGKDRNVATAEVDQRLGLSAECQRMEKAAADLKQQRIAADSEVRERERSAARNEKWKRDREVTKSTARGRGSFDDWE